MNLAGGKKNLTKSAIPQWAQCSKKLIRLTRKIFDRVPEHTQASDSQDSFVSCAREARTGKIGIIRRLSFAAIAASLFLSFAIAHAQTVTGSVTGEVTDPTGAVITNAKVVVRNIETGVETSETTNGTGVYTVRFLPIGHYDVTVTAPGFAPRSFPAFTLEVDQTVKVDAQLEVGSASTVVKITDSSPILNTTDGALGVTLSTNEIQTIPLNGRDFSSVTLFVPGAVGSDPTGFSGENAIERNTTSNGIASINGNRNQENNYTLDGIDMNEGQNNLIAYNPAPDAIAEMKVISANAPASYGNVNGGSVVTILKSGTNHFHGSAYADLQNANLNANSWSNKHQTPIIPITPYTQTIFGGTFGGPILHDKLFFFADYEGTRFNSGGTGTASVLTTAMRTGDFSAVPTQLYDTQNGFTPYAGNQNIPIVNPVAQYLIAHPNLYPLPNAIPNDGIVENNLQGPQRQFRANNQGDFKTEWNPRNADKLTGFYSQSDGLDGSVRVLPITFPALNTYPTKIFGTTWVHTISPSMVNEVRAGFTRVVWNQGVPTDPTGAFGLTGDTTVGIPFNGAQPYVGFSSQSLSNHLTSVGTTAAPQILRDNTFSYGDNLSWQVGRHLLNIGVLAIRYQQNYLNSANFGSLGSFTYTGAFTGANGSSGFSGADFVLDLVRQVQIEDPGGLVGNRQWRAAGFLQDDWKISPALTVNLGIRYEIDQPWYEINNKTANVLLNTGQVIYAGPVPEGAPAGSGVCGNRSCYQPNYDQVMPRLGFAYQLTPKWVVRGGYGATSFFEGNSSNQRLTYNSPFVVFSQLKAKTPTATSGGTPFTVQEGFNPAANGQNLNAAGFGAWPQNMQPAYIQEYNLTTEYALTDKLSLTVGYVGETGQHVGDYRNANQLTLAQAAAGAPGPFDNLVGSGNVLLLTESEAEMNYNAGQATLRQRDMHGLEYTINYTYGRSMTNSSGNYGVPNVNSGTGSFQNGYDSRADYGPSGDDVRHNLSAVGVYALPIGRGRMFGTSANRALDAAIGGWSISASAIAYSGFPTDIETNGNDNTNSLGQARPNQYRKFRIANRSLNHWWGTDPSATPCPTDVDNGICAYGPTAPYTFGTASAESERVPGFDQIDTSAFKDFHINESQAVGFRADIFNLLNTANYGNPDSNIQDASFGQITSVRGEERRIQLTLHYTF